MFSSQSLCHFELFLSIHLINMVRVFQGKIVVFLTVLNYIFKLNLKGMLWTQYTLELYIQLLTFLVYIFGSHSLMEKRDKETYQFI